MISVYEAERHGSDHWNRLQKSIFFCPPHSKKSLSCTVVLKRGPQYWQCSFFRSVVTFFEKKLVFALWLGKIIILLVTLLKPYAGSWISDSWGGGVAIFYILWGYLPLENYYKINQNMIDVQVRNLPPMRTTRKVRIIEIGSCWRFGPCRFSSYGMYLNIRTNHSLFYQEYISAQVIIPRPHPQHILFPTSHEYLLSLALEWMIKFSPGLKNIYTIPQVLLVNKYYKLNSFFWSFFFDVLSWFI